MGVYMIDYLCYREAESEGIVSTLMARWRGTHGSGQEGGQEGGMKRRSAKGIDR